MGALSAWDPEWESHAQEQETQQELTGEPESWFPAASLTRNWASSDGQTEHVDWVPMGSLTSEIQPAAVGTRSRQPHSFMPADNTQPRVRSNSADRVVSPALVPLQFNMTAHVHPSKLQELFGLLCDQGSAAGAAASPSAAGTPRASVAALQPQLALERSVIEQLSPMLPDAAVDPEEVQLLLARHEENSQVQHLHLFSSSEPSSGITKQWGPPGQEKHAQPPKAASDSGCVPSIMVESLIKALGLNVTLLTPQEHEQVRGIDGMVSPRIYGRTEPVTIILCKGTPYEVSLTAHRGLLAVRGTEASYMYDIVIGRDLLDQVSGFVLPVMSRFFYMPRMQLGDISTMHSMPVLSGRPAASAGHPMQVAALSESLAFMPVCSAVFAGNNSIAEADTAAAADAPSNPAAADAATQTDSKPISRRKQRLFRQALAAEIVREVPADCGPTAGAWGVASTAPAVLLWLMLWPLLWLLRHARDKLEQAWRSLFGAAMQPSPRQGTTFWRLGRGHRSAAGETIYLQPDAKSSGRKPRSVIILRPVLTLRHVMAAWSSKTLLFLLMLAAVCITSTQAMDTYLAVTADSASLSLGPRLVPPLPYNTAHLLAAGLTDNLGSAGECFRNQWA